MARFRAELESFDFDQPRPLEELLGWTIERMQHGIVQMANPRYFGLFNPAPSFPAQCADRIASLFNPQLASSASSPVPVELESQVIRAIARRAAMGEETTGHFATGWLGIELHLVAVRPHRRAPGFCKRRSARFCRPGEVLHVTRLSHCVAEDRAPGGNRPRRPAPDRHRRSRPHGSECATAAVAEDRAGGAVPVMIVATAGTTGAGMIDPLQACADIAKRKACGTTSMPRGAARHSASDRLRPRSPASSEPTRSPSTPHKWLATTMGCAMYITPHGHLLSKRSMPRPASCHRACPESILI